MTQALLALSAGLVGALVGLTGTVLTLRHQQQLERRKWMRRETVDSVAAVLREVNNVWRALDRQEAGVTYADVVWVDSANAIDRASLVVTDIDSLRLLGELWEALLTVRWGRGSPTIWEDEIWPLTHSLKAQVRISLGASPDIGNSAAAWRPTSSRLEARNRRLHPELVTDDDQRGLPG